MMNIPRKNFNVSWLNSTTKKSLCGIFLLLTIMLTASSCKKEPAPSQWYSETSENGDPILGVYESRIPCNDCERLKFAIVIYGNSQTNVPVTYAMSRIYVGKSEDRVSNTGNVEIVQGTAIDTAHIVYRLTTGAPEEYRSFWKIDENLLFILDDDLSPRVGDAGYGYVLNRIH
ncbi:MAG: copper resistance protein NlpE N-terminal domain-containing protein [Bacteroidia bacterium]|nr:copper resistance protein NlpE N-terminal domain-containing protein [Bacteroidia bacterium]